MRDSSRRTFLMNSSATVAASAALASLEIAGNAYARADDTIKVGLVGCGGRGTGAAEQALTADKGVKLVAVADAFQNRADSCLELLKKSDVGSQVDVASDKVFIGFDAYKKVIDEVDVVLLTSTPHFRPEHLAYAVAKGKHVFMEKPVATDAPGVRSVLQSVAEARSKGTAIVSGFCWRYDKPRRETMKRYFDGAVGKALAIETTYNSSGVWEPPKTREDVGSEMELQMRNWYYYDWLSGDHIVEQAIHGIDTMSWALGDKPPIQCFGVGGRQVRVEPKYGNIYDHFSIVYEYPDNVRGYHQCRHWKGTALRVKDYILGEKGVVDVFGNSISGENKWRYRGAKSNMYQVEHDEMFAALRAGKTPNNGEEAARTTLVAIMGRMAAYTGEVITYEAAMNSKENLGPKEYVWGDAPQRPVPMPGLTKFI
jgi:predicted dehydrogenase